MPEVVFGEILELTRDVRLFTLESETGLLPAAPGAHIDLRLPDGAIRQYSLISPLCSARRYVIAVKREVAGRGGSAWLHDHARTGMKLSIGAPRHLFVLEDNQACVLLIAGGIGIIPIYSMFRHLCEAGRNVHLHYWCNAPEDVLFLETLREMPEVTLHYPGDARKDAGAVVAAAPEAATIYCCGPDRMLRTCEASLRVDCRLRTERFTPIATTKTTCDFTVRLARSGREIDVGAEETILQAVLAAGVDALYSCEEGVCGACETVVLDGEPEHWDAVRVPADHARRRSMMICCSRSKSRMLTLDL